MSPWSNRRRCLRVLGRDGAAAGGAALAVTSPPVELALMVLHDPRQRRRPWLHLSTPRACPVEASPSLADGAPPARPAGNVDPVPALRLLAPGVCGLWTAHAVSVTHSGGRKTAASLRFFALALGVDRPGSASENRCTAAVFVNAPCGATWQLVTGHARAPGAGKRNVSRRRDTRRGVTCAGSSADDTFRTHDAPSVRNVSHLGADRIGVACATMLPPTPSLGDDCPTNRRARLFSNTFTSTTGGC